MKIQAIVGILFVTSVLASQDEFFGELGLGPSMDYDESNVRRDKRTLTTICVEIKPTSPYEEPYFMCKGTDMPGYSQSSSHVGSESESSDYSVKPKPSYKPSSSGQDDYHGPVKSNYYPEPVKYEKPSSYSSSSKPGYEKNPSYSSYEKPAHESHNDYSKPAHSHTYEKPSYHKESAYPSKPAYGSSSYGHSESAKPSYGGGHYEHSDSSYSSSKSEYSSKLNPSKYTSYDHAEKPSYAPVKPSSYSEQYPAKSSPKPSSDYYAKPYGTSEKTQSSKSGSNSQGYRMSSEEIMQQPSWGLQETHNAGFGYRPMDSPVSHFNYETSRQMDQHLDEPIRMDLSTSQPDGPTLQASHRGSMVPPVPYGTVGSPYNHAAPYAPSYPSYESPVPSYAPPAPSYVPHSAPAPVYVPPAPTYPPSYGMPCPQSFLYSFQPAFISVPCASSPPSYGQPTYAPSTYGHPLGAARSSDDKPQQEHSESTKLGDDNSESEESHDYDEKSTAKSDSNKGQQTKPDTPKDTKPADSKTPEKKPQEQPTAGTGKATDSQGNQKNGTKGNSDTKAAYDAMVEMAKIAAQLNKDDANQGGNNKKKPD